MAQIELLLPKMGESVAEATVTSWLKNEGDFVELEEGILEIATDKVDSEVPSDYEGTLIKKLHQEGDVVKIGAPFAIIEVEGDHHNDEKEYKTSTPVYEESITDTIDESLDVKEPIEHKSAIHSPIESTSNRFYSPLVKSIAKKEGIQLDELQKIQGSGREGRVTKADILAYLETRGSVHDTPVKPQYSSEPNSYSAPVRPAVSLSGHSDLIEMDRMRKLIAEHMVESKKTAPHVTSVIEIDVTNLVEWRNRVKEEFLKKEGYKLTFTPIFVEAVAKAIKDFPMVNVSVEGNSIRVKKDANIGMAVALPSGNLIVPVVKGANNLNLAGTARSVNDLTQKARNNKLAPEDVQEGTFTITNIGTFGNIIGTPIINQPEVAILATGAIQKKPAVIETSEGDFIGIRQMMFLSMSYDHRVVDGMLGGSFLRKVGDYLENFEIDRQIW